MSSSQFAPRYSGLRVLPFAPPGRAHGPGMCRSCGQPSGDCRCGCRQCRKESKELMFTPDAQTGRTETGSLAGSMLSAGSPAATTFPTAFIGGGCCVHVSVEYAPITATVQSVVAIWVRDTEGTNLIWEKIDPPGTHYQVKENVITTKPGATILLVATNATARARWCEVFSC
jgi:hypothetical protein